MLGKKEIKKIVITILKEEIDPVAIYFFGSVVNGEMTEKSDVDIAFLLKPKSKRLDSSFENNLIGELSTKIGREIDLINIRDVSTVFQFEILKTGECIYSNNNDIRGEFEMLTISYYQKLSDERADIIEEGLSSGNFYSL